MVESLRFKKKITKKFEPALILFKFFFWLFDFLSVYWNYIDKFCTYKQLNFKKVLYMFGENSIVYKTIGIMSL